MANFVQAFYMAFFPFFTWPFFRFSYGRFFIWLVFFPRLFSGPFFYYRCFSQAFLIVVFLGPVCLDFSHGQCFSPGFSRGHRFFRHIFFYRLFIWPVFFSSGFSYCLSVLGDSHQHLHQ